jgi:type II secretory pathway predicted ATPase ExeA
MSANAFGCREEPFAKGADLRFTYHSAAFVDGYNRALTTLIGRRAPILLIGEPGMGKTTVAGSLARDLRAAGWLSVGWSGADRVHNRQPTAGELVALLSTRDNVALRVASAETHRSRPRFNEPFSGVAGEHTLLLIDDANDLPEETLADLCREAIGEIGDEVSFRLLLIGSIELLRHVYIAADLRKRSAPELIRLAPLGPNEVARYVAHRMQAAGGDVQRCFTEQALQLVARYARGNPGTTNRLCAATLVLSEFSDTRPATAELVHEAAIDCWIADGHSRLPEVIQLPRARPVSVATKLLPIPPVAATGWRAPAVRLVEAESASAADDTASAPAPMPPSETPADSTPAMSSSFFPAAFRSIKTFLCEQVTRAGAGAAHPRAAERSRRGFREIVPLLLAAALLIALFAGGSLGLLRWFGADKPQPAVPVQGRAVAPMPGSARRSAVPEAPVPAVHSDELAALLRQGDNFLALDDITGARLYYEAAARRGSAAAAAALARTYDPEALALAGRSIVLADKARALHWYRIARDLDDPTVGARIEALTRDR